ncbi:MAG: Hsp20 family protein [Chitinivibrionales bacterium]|nr:Hsp20 family protein [Chitinivibrionales bacterium]
MMWRIDPWKELERMRSDLDNIFSGSNYGVTGRSFPLMNAYDKGEEIVITAELPGMTKDDVSITYSDGVLTLSGQKKPLFDNDGYALVRQERSSGDFEKSFTLPCKIEQDKITALFKNGILDITLPKCEESKPKRIAVDVQ